MIKILAIGALGYAAFRYVQWRAPSADGIDNVRVAGGGLSRHASIQGDPDVPPAIDPYKE